MFLIISKNKLISRLGRGAGEQGSWKPHDPFREFFAWGSLVDRSAFIILSSRLWNKFERGRVGWFKGEEKEEETGRKRAGEREKGSLF